MDCSASEADRIRRLVRGTGSIPEIDVLMASAWPAAEVEDSDGWLIRHTSGVTRRANSVLAIGPQVDVDATVDRAERFYRDRDAPPTFLVSEVSAPSATAAVLGRRGYESQATTWLLVGEAERVAEAIAPDPRWEITVQSEPSDDWFDTYWSVEGTRHDATAANIVRTQLLKPAAKARFVTAYRAGQPTAGGDGGVDRAPVSVGQVVIDGGWGYLQCLATSSAGRRKGAASQVFRARVIEALHAGATGVFAAVMANNEASLGLCERYGLRRSHRYGYFVRPPS